MTIDERLELARLERIAAQWPKAMTDFEIERLALLRYFATTPAERVVDDSVCDSIC